MMRIVNLVYLQLIAFSVQVGHTIKNTLLFAAWYVFKYRMNLSFINLNKFLLYFNVSMLFVVASVGAISPV
mgnify:CR=1 FL=1